MILGNVKTQKEWFEEIELFHEQALALATVGNEIETLKQLAVEKKQRMDSYADSVSLSVSEVPEEKSKRLDVD